MIRQQKEQQYYISEEKLKQIQLVQQDLIREVAHICKKCDIYFNMVGGTMLGQCAMDLTVEALKGCTVRAWLSGHLHTERSTGTMLDLAALEWQGITDVILNEPERYRLTIEWR